MKNTSSKKTTEVLLLPLETDNRILSSCIAQPLWCDTTVMSHVVWLNDSSAETTHIPYHTLPIKRFPYNLWISCYIPGSCSLSLSLSLSLSPSLCHPLCDSYHGLLPSHRHPLCTRADYQSPWMWLTDGGGFRFSHIRWWPQIFKAPCLSVLFSLFG